MFCYNRRVKIYLGADHGGYKMKEELKTWLLGKGHEVVDVGAERLIEGDDFVDYSLDVVDGLLGDLEARGILLCRNGVGVSIAANRYTGTRCALGFDEKQIERARRDDNINCLALPADYIDLEKAKELIEVFVKTDFSNETRYQRRVAKMGMIGDSGGCGGGCCGGGGYGDGCC